jgi:hypothetical protein
MISEKVGGKEKARVAGDFPQGFLYLADDSNAKAH